jgi:creatinine amidohydrolase
VTVFPAVPFGVSPYFQAYPGSMTLRVETLCGVVRDLLDSLKRSGFRRILLVNGHGGNAPAGALAQEWMMDNPDCRVRFHDWWRAPRTMAKVLEIDPLAGHGSWMENFPWTRLVGTPADEVKEMVDIARLKTLPPFEARNLLEDGCFGGRSQRPDADVLAIWQVAVEETRAMLEDW